MITFIQYGEANKERDSNQSVWKTACRFWNSAMVIKFSTKGLPFSPGHLFHFVSLCFGNSLKYSYLIQNPVSLDSFVSPSRETKTLRSDESERFV